MKFCSRHILIAYGINPDAFQKIVRFSGKAGSRKNGEHGGGLADGEGEVDIHEDVAAAFGDDDVGKQRGEWQEGTGDGE